MTKKLYYGIIAFIFSFTLAQAGFAAKIDKIIAFGDSMTDNGNIYKLTKEAHKVMPFIPVIPKEPPYFEGRFSNGPIWVDNLAQEMNVELEDYAYGGSWAEPIIDSKLNVPFGLDVQVAYYLVKSALDFHKSRHLYVIWAGANDYIKGRSDPEYATDNTVGTIRKQIEWLMFYGAENIYVLNVPNLGIVPEVAAKGPDFAAQVTELTKMHNRKLDRMIRRLQAKNPNAHIILGDTTKYFDDILVNPEKYNLRNITDPCYGGGYWLQDKFADMQEIQAAKEANIDILNIPSLREAYLNSRLAKSESKVCNKPQEYLFWDHIHPSQTTHTIVSALALKRLHDSGIDS